MTKDLEERILMQRVEERKQIACAKKLYTYILALLDEKGHETSRELEYCPATYIPISIYKEYEYLRGRFIAQKYGVDARGTIMFNFSKKEGAFIHQGKKFEEAVAVYDKKHKKRVFYAYGITKDDVYCYIPGIWEKSIEHEPEKSSRSQKKKINLRAIEGLKLRFGL